MPIIFVKCSIFIVLLFIAAIWDIRKREIPDSISMLIFLTGFIAISPMDATFGLLLTAIPYFLAAILIKNKDGFAVGGGDIKLMAACGFVLGVGLGTFQSIISLVLALIYGIIKSILSKNKSKKNMELPLAPFFCAGGIFSCIFLITNQIN